MIYVWGCEDSEEDCEEKILEIHHWNLVLGLDQISTSVGPKILKALFVSVFSHVLNNVWHRTSKIWVFSDYENLDFWFEAGSLPLTLGCFPLCLYICSYCNGFCCYVQEMYFVFSTPFLEASYTSQAYNQANKLLLLLSTLKISTFLMSPS